eukprot:5914604-Pyramimonas_sp.AAC.1
MALFDFGDAFPSLMTEWMLLMLIHSGFVGGVRYLLEALYWLPTAYVELAGAMVHFVCVSCGLAQGCPSSGSLWAIAMNPFIHHMMQYTDRDASRLSALG